MKKWIALSLASATFLVASPSYAQFAKAEDAIKYRQSAFSLIGSHFGRLGAMANGKVPFDAKVAQQNADLVAFLASLPAAGFGEGTEGGKAKPEIWKEQAKFKEHNEKMITETAKLAVVAKTATPESLKTAFGAAAETCKTCHDAFRNK